MNRNGRGPGGYNNNSGQGNNTRIISIPAPTSATSANGLALTFIQDLRPNMRAFNLECILLDKAAEPRRTLDQQLLTTFLVADKTGSIVLIIWGEEGQLLRSGDIVRLQGGEAKLFKGRIQLSTSKHGKYKRIGEDTIQFNEAPNWSEFDWIPDPSMPNMMMPKLPAGKMGGPPGGFQQMPVGPNMQQQQHQQRNMQGSNQPAINPAFRGNHGPSHIHNNPNININNNINGNVNNGHGPNGSNANNNGMGRNQGGPGSGGPVGQAGPMGPMGPMMPQQGGPKQQMPHGGPNNSNSNMGHGPGPGPGPGAGGPGGHRQHHGGSFPQQQQQSQQQPGGHAPGPPNMRKGKSRHKDLDAPDVYPSPRTGFTNSQDEFQRDMKLVQGDGSVGLGVFGGPGGGGGHQRKKPKMEDS